MRSRMRRDLTAALKGRDRVAMSALRAALAAIENAAAPAADHAAPAVAGDDHVAGSVPGHGAAEVARRDLDETDLCAVVAREVDERTLAAERYEELGRGAEARRLRAEADVLRGYLPESG